METNTAELPVTDRLWSWLEANKMQALIGAGVLLVVAGIAGFMTWQKSEKEISSGEALSNISVPLTASGNAGQPGTAEAYLKVAAEYPKSTTAARAVLLAAGNLFDNGKFDEAKTQFERFTRQYNSSPFMGQALLGIAACLDAQNKTNEAISAYRSLVERHPNDNAMPQAKFALGRLYEAQGKPEQARTYYEDISRPDQYAGSLANEAGIGLEELKWKYPSLFAPPPAPAAPAATSFLPGTVTNTIATPTGSAATTNLIPLKIEQPKK